MLTLTVCAVRGHHGRIWGKPESEGTAIYNFSMLAVQESLPPIAIVARCGVGVRYPICQEAGEARGNAASLEGQVMCYQPGAPPRGSACWPSRAR